MKEMESWEILVSLSENEISLAEAHDQILRLFSVVRQSEQLLNMTLEQAIAKAKPNLDKITDVDKHLDDIR